MAKKYYELSVEDRIEKLFNDKFINLDEKNYLLNSVLKNEEVLSLSENTIGEISLPFSIIFPVKVDNSEYIVPMSIEEPSVVAAASNGIKRISQGIGFETSISEKLMIGEIVWSTNQDFTEKINKNSENIKQIISNLKPSLIKRGGGMIKYETVKYDDFFELLLYIDTADAMGANTVNTICEKVADYLDGVLSCEHLIAILSNDGSNQLVTTKATIDFENLSSKNFSGKIIADKIVKLSEFTQISDYRAVTNNKGILNGIFAVLNATGNDTRAVSVAVSSYLKNKNSLSSWVIEDDKLVGELTLPLNIGSVGGAISSLTSSKIAMKLLNVKNVRELSGIVASVGLANNLSAMRAIVTEGIQKGHMALQSKSLAITVGAKGKEIDKLSDRLNQIKKFNTTIATEILKDIRRKSR